MARCFEYCFLFAGEASASILWENDDWFHFKENKAFTEPKYTSADYIRHVIPNVKVIICVRNPTDRYEEWKSGLLYNLFFILWSVVTSNS